MKSILVLMLALAHAKLGVLVPNELSSKFVNQNNSIPFSVANFGHIPWGRKLIGTVMIAEPLDACTTVAPQAHLESEKPFILVKRGGGCTFVSKVRNCQSTGASMVIIMDDSIEPTERLVMSDDGFGYSVTLPSIFIREKDGELIQSFIEDQTEATGDQPRNNAVLVMKFDVIKSENTEVMLALTFQNRDSFKLVREFKQYYMQLKNDNVQFKVFYDQFTCPSCRANNFSKPEPNCLGGGQYCQIDPDGDKVANGRQVMEEQLRQICLFQTDPDHWWKYVPLFDKECVLVQAYEQCSRQLMKAHGIDGNKVDKCVIGSFDQDSNPSRLLQTNSILREQSQFKYYSGLRFYPGAVINNQSYLGTIDASDIFGEVCNSMVKHPSYCQEYFDQDYQKNTQIKSESNVTTIILFVLLVLVVFFLFMVFVYRRMVRKEMSKEMSTQVNQMVSQYISFYEAKDKKVGN